MGITICMKMLWENCGKYHKIITNIIYYSLQFYIVDTICTAMTDYNMRGFVTAGMPE